MALSSKWKITNSILEKLHSYPHYQRSYPQQKFQQNLKLDIDNVLKLWYY